MRWMKWTGLAAAILLIIACCMPWVLIVSKNITITGIDPAGSNFGKPGYFHFILTAFFLVFNFTSAIWAKRVNLAVTALNLAWAIRNYFIITLCRAGECPEKKTAVYMILLASLLMLVSALLPDIKPKQKIEKQ
jgi:hypothetical protein